MMRISYPNGITVTLKSKNHGKYFDPLANEISEYLDKSKNFALFQCVIELFDFKQF